MSGKYFWLKLKKDFFKRHDIRIIESMPNGKDYILFYLKLLVESVDHDGNLRFSDTIPYNDEMLAVITNTNIDIVKSALEVFINLKMIEILDDQTIYMNEVTRMIGSAAGNDNAIRQKRFRDNQKALKQGTLESSVTKNNASVTECVTDSNESKSKSKSKSKELDNIIISPRENLFEMFWAAYPQCFRKANKKGCKAKFIKIKDLENIFPDIISSLEMQKRSKQWSEQDGQFIPAPLTWINQERWTVKDERTEIQQNIDEATEQNISGFLF